MNRVWTFIKLYFVIFMFTEPGTWFRWLCLVFAGLMSAMPSAPVFRGLTARLQANLDGFLQPPAPNAPAPLLRQQQQQQQQIEGQRQEEAPRPPATDPAMPLGTTARVGPDLAAATAAQEHRQRHFDALREAVGRAERALGLFVATLIPGVGERHVRAREEARRELERLEREREAGRERESRERVARLEARMGRVADLKSNGNATKDGVEEEVVGECSGSAEKKPLVDEVASAAAAAPAPAAEEEEKAES
jgi:hypothetical protein